MLTGKNRKQFREYYESLPKNTPNHILYSTFMGLPLSMQFGVVQSYADSIGVCLFVKQDFDGYLNYLRGYIPFVDNEAIYKNNDCFETRDEARLAAIKAFDEIVNAK